MNDSIHWFIRVFIGLYKWIELQILNLFSGYVERSLRQKMANIDVILESDDMEKQGAIKQASKFKKVVRLNVTNKRLFTKIANRGYIAMGEGYVNGDFTFTKDENDITEFVTRCLDNNFYKYYFNCWNSLLHTLEFDIINLQTSSRAWEVGKRHYDLGNQFFRSFLDSNMNYSCGYWANANNLEEAQKEKMRLVAEKLYLLPGMRVLDLGCGWGAMCKYLAETYAVECVGVTVSNEGYQCAKEVCSGLPVQILLQDYRDVNQKFDRIFSIEMFEHVGFRNYRDFFKVAHRCLKDDGIFLLHTTTLSDSTIKRVDPWIHTYVYPNISHPYVHEICSGFDGLFVMEDWHNMSMDMSKTFDAWRANFIKNWPLICNQYDDQFYRMWTYLTSISCAAYKTKKYQLAHVVLTKASFQNRYIAVR